MYLLRIATFSQEASKYLKGIPCYPRKILKSSPKHLILPSIFQGCFEIVLQDYTPEHVNIPRKRQIFKDHKKQSPKDVL